MVVSGCGSKNMEKLMERRKVKGQEEEDEQCGASGISQPAKILKLGNFTPLQKLPANCNTYKNREPKL